MALAYDDRTVAADDFNITGIIGDFLNDTQFSYTDIYAEELTYILHVYLTPILIIVGVIGNLLSIIVFYKSKLRRLSTSQYLSALAVSDTIFLVQLIPPWLKAVKASLVFVRSGFCQMFVYLTYVSSANSSWLVVVFTVERFVAVIYPLRSRACTARRARVCIACVGASCVALNTPVLWLAEARGADCDIDRALMDYAARFNMLDTVLSFTLPLAITTVLNIWIMVGVCHGSRARRRLTRDTHEPPPPRVHPSRRHCSRRTRSHLQRSQQRITRMLLLVSSVFVLLNLPAYSMRIAAYAMNLNSYEYSGHWAALQQICQWFFNANFGINFFLYCLSGQNFRLALLHTFPCIGRARRMLRKLCCWSADSPPPPPEPSVSNSITLNTGGRERRAGWTCSTHERSEDGRPYMQMWHFFTLEQMRRFQAEMVHDYIDIPIEIFIPELDTIEEVDETTPEIENTPPAMIRQIPFNIIPGEIAPLGPDPMQPFPELAPSPSPPVVVERSEASAEITNAHLNETAAPPQYRYFTPKVIQDEREFPYAPAVITGMGIVRQAFEIPVERASFPQRARSQPLSPRVEGGPGPGRHSI